MTNQTFFLNEYQVNLPEFYCYKSIANKQRNHSFLCLLLIQTICIICNTGSFKDQMLFTFSWREPLPEASGAEEDGEVHIEVRKLNVKIKFEFKKARVPEIDPLEISQSII